MGNALSVHEQFCICTERNNVSGSDGRSQSSRRRNSKGSGSVRFRTPGRQTVLLRGREQDLFVCSYILSAQLSFCWALRNLIDGSISSQSDARQEGTIAVLVEDQRVRARGRFGLVSHSWGEQT